MVSRLLILLALAFSTGYGVKQKRCGLENPYFNVVLCGLFALLLARVYYLIVILSDGSDEILTVGTFGQAAGYLFFFTANLHYLPEYLREKQNRRFSPAGIAGTAVICLLLLWAAWTIGTLDAWIGELLCCCTFGGALLTSLNLLHRGKSKDGSNALRPFACCICMLVLLNTLQELMLAFDYGTLEKVLQVLHTAFCILVLLVMLPLLKRGLKRCGL